MTRTLHLLTLLALILLARPTAAQELQRGGLKLPSTVYLAAGAADMATTAHGFGVSPYFGESNPAANWVRREFGSPAMFAAGAAADVATVWAVNRWIGQRHPRLATVALYAGAAARTWLAVHNVRLAQRLGACRNVTIPHAC